MIIALGCDHIVTEIKNEIKNYLKKLNFQVVDCGNYTKTRTHYAIYGHAVAAMVATKKANFGIVICGTGVGISNSANKTKNIRAVLTHNCLVAKKARELYDANVLCLGGRIVGIGLLLEIIDVFLKTNYLKKQNKLINQVNKLIHYENYDLKIFDSIIKDWEEGKYTNNEKQEKVDLPQCEICK